ncbi:MAG: galactose-1-phosphate uridylyltransferase [Pirellulales bacterium]
MSEWRKDLIVDRWVIIAPDRAGRPDEFRQQRPVAPSLAGGKCPFCEGNERSTPGEIAAVRERGSAADAPGWRVRVVPNKYPAVVEGAELAHPPGKPFECRPGAGVHEVIIESPRHRTLAGQLTAEEMSDVVGMYCQRLGQHRRLSRFACGLLFKNVGQAAGASLAHLHSQLVVLPMVPAVLQAELDGARRFANATGECVFCRMLQLERQADERVVEVTPGFVALCPYASRFAMETWIVPRQHSQHVDLLSTEAQVELAELLQRTLTKLERVLADPTYNMIVHTAPFDTNPVEHYHWHIEILPRQATAAGFEWGSGYHINTVSPEAAARLLQSAEIHHSPRQVDPI